MNWYLVLVLALVMSCGPSSSEKQTEEVNSSVEVIHHPDAQKVDVMIDNQLFTSYCWPDKVYKPIFYPIMTAGGHFVTRGYPLATRDGERGDHRHQVGAWFNYGSVNGNDFWGNGAEGLTRKNLGQVKLLGIESVESMGDKGLIVARSSWLDSVGQELLTEHSTFEIGKAENYNYIDRTTTLTASNGDVVFEDTKEGSFAIRLNRQLELPTDGDVTVLRKQANGSFEESKDLDNSTVTGDYLSSEGITGYDVWGTRAKWMQLSGEIEGEKVSVVIFDHPNNVNYPTYWHARGYGLFSANPFGVEDFVDGSEPFNFSLKKGESFTQNYRIVIGSDVGFTPEQINQIAEDFNNK
ncbi:DUF6807 domain-containing protein [Membranihabitans marinus]|uniref:DUF6807 domain-containing protein n=1 Tax=Membranihabitans marinus TaxID=1227546 RepID=UPI001F2C54E7|nr:PmoA family protein [Membranihabitans marinus]